MGRLPDQLGRVTVRCRALPQLGVVQIEISALGNDVGQAVLIRVTAIPRDDMVRYDVLKNVVVASNILESTALVVDIGDQFPETILIGITDK